MTDHRAHQLSHLVGRFAEATTAHRTAQAMAAQAVALDLALELEAAKHGFDFHEVALEAQRLASL